MCACVVLLLRQLTRVLAILCPVGSTHVIDMERQAAKAIMHQLEVNTQAAAAVPAASAAASSTQIGTAGDTACGFKAAARRALSLDQAAPILQWTAVTSVANITLFQLGETASAGATTTLASEIQASGCCRRLLAAGPL